MSSLRCPRTHLAPNQILLKWCMYLLLVRKDEGVYLRLHTHPHSKSLHRCRKCQKPSPHLTPFGSSDAQGGTSLPTPPSSHPISPITANHATGICSNTLLMTCLVLIHAPDGSSMRVRAILDSASSTSFVSERLTQTLHLPRTHQNVRISGVAGLSHGTSLQSTVMFTISPLQSHTEKSEVSAIVVPRVTCDLPVNPITPRLSWTHLSDIPLADPDFGSPGRIDSELTFLLTRYGTAGGMDLPSPQLLLKLNLVGFLQVVLNLRITVLIKSPHTTYLSLLEMIYCANFGKSRKVLGLIPISPLRNVWSYNTSRTIIVAPWREDPLFPFPRNHTHHC